MSSRREFALLLNALFHDRPRLAAQAFDTFETDAEFRRVHHQFFDQIESIDAKNKVYQRLNQFNSAAYANTSFICSEDPEYPEMLKALADPPVVLFYKGDITLLARDQIAVVGPRNITPYGRQVTQYFTEALVGYFVITSGLADGVDAVAHSTALGLGQPTIGVLGCGIDVVYPQKNKALYAQIEKSGLIVTEYPPGSRPLKYRFPQRNRIVCGLSKGVVVCEAGQRSGSLITANLALEQNKEVFAVPGSIFSEQSDGVHKLIQDGAKLTQDIKDIIEEFNLLLKPPRKKPRKVEGSPPPAPGRDKSSLAPEERNVVTLVEGGVDQIDQLVLKTQMSIHRILQLTTFLEGEGWLSQNGGRYTVSAHGRQ